MLYLLKTHNMKLVRPLAVFDLETTGVNITQDKICEIAILKIHPDGSEEKYHEYVNPEIKIPKEISEIHGITDEMIKDKPTFKDIAPAVSKFIENCDLAGFNSNKFDIPVLAEEFMRANIDPQLNTRKFVDVQNIFHKLEQRTLVAAYKFYCQQDLENAHSAMHDTEATWNVLKAQIDKYDVLSDDVDTLSEFSKTNKNELLDFAGRIAENENGEAVYNFGKHKGKTVRQIAKDEPGYYGWMLDADFPLYTKKILREEMTKIKAINQQYKEKKTAEMDDKLEALKNKFK